MPWEIDDPMATKWKSEFMTTGTVKWFNEEKGFGFIAPEGGGEDLFVHATEVRKANMPTLRNDQKVSFERKENRGRWSAVNLKEIG